MHPYCYACFAGAASTEESTDAYRLLECMHIICQSCIKSTHTADRTVRCPLCRHSTKCHRFDALQHMLHPEEAIARHISSSLRFQQEHTLRLLQYYQQQLGGICQARTEAQRTSQVIATQHTHQVTTSQFVQLQPHVNPGSSYANEPGINSATILGASSSSIPERYYAKRPQFIPVAAAAAAHGNPQQRPKTVAVSRVQNEHRIAPRPDKDIITSRKRLSLPCHREKVNYSNFTSGYSASAGQSTHAQANPLHSWSSRAVLRGPRPMTFTRHGSSFGNNHREIGESKPRTTAESAAMLKARLTAYSHRDTTVQMPFVHSASYNTETCD